jgi:hypothetical protein
MAYKNRVAVRILGLIKVALITVLGHRYPDSQHLFDFKERNKTE